MSIVLNWNGETLPDQVREQMPAALQHLSSGRYVLEPVDDAPELTDEQEIGIEAAIESVRQGKGVSLEAALDRQAMTPSSKKAADIATIVAALIASLAFGVGLWQFSATQRLTRENLQLQAETLRNERETKAVELFLKFNELQRDVAAKPLPRKGEAAFWYYNALVALTESVFKLTEGDSGWDETVVWMLEVQRPFLEQTIFNCNTFTTTFVEKVRRIVPALQCL